MPVVAPFASTPIIISMRSLIGRKYRMINCVECGAEFIERSDDRFFQLQPTDSPSELHVNTDGELASICPRCTQKYVIVLSVEVNRPLKSEGELYLQPQSIFLEIEPTKTQRDIYCHECGKAFFGLSDRIKTIVDEVVPMNISDSTRAGPMLPRCRFQYCKQHYEVRL